MKTSSKKMSFVLGAAALLTSIGTWLNPGDPFRPVMDNSFTTALRKKIQLYMEVRPEERVYVQLDKPLYSPGDDIWFSAWIREGSSMLPSAKSDIVTIELVSPKGTVEKKIDLIASRGLAAGDFALDPSAPGGIYKIRAYTQWMKNDGEDRCFEKLVQVQEIVLPALKMKVDFEKKAYGAGDEVKAFIDLATNENKPLSNKALKFTAAIKGKEILAQVGSTDEEGRGTISFHLPAKLQSSDGLLNILVEHNGNTESISRSIPIVRNEVRLAIYPEGGDLVNGIESRVAFRAVNEFGKPADVDAELCDAGGRVVSKFSSFHMGMGSFVFTPETGKEYHVRIIRPAGISEKYNLPASLDRGYVMEARNDGRKAAFVSIRSTEAGEMSLVAQMRGKVLYTTVLPVLPGNNSFSFSTEKFPMGVLQLSLFDHKGIGRAERLVFVNAHKQLSVSITTDKQKYLPREKVKMSILVKDENGLPAPAMLSMAVVNDQLLSFADDRSGNLLSQLLLQDDIKEKIEEPAFYFNMKEKKSPQALDLLMMTAGWRRFTWEKMLDDEIAAPKYHGRKAIIAGVIMDGNTMKPIEGVSLRGQSTGQWTTDKEGRFTIKGVALYDPLHISIEKSGYYTQAQQVYDYKGELVWYMYPYQLHTYRNDDGIPMAAEMLAGTAAQRVEDREPAMKKREVFSVVAPREGKAAKQEEVKLAKPVAQHRAANMKLKRIAGGGLRDMEMDMQPHAAYHRARQFAAPLYEKVQEVKERTDFRNTIYWNPSVEIGHSGRKTIEFYASDDITSFRTVAEGIGSDGLAGRAEETFFTQLPFQLRTRIPSNLTGDDIVDIPVTLTNNTNKPLGGTFTVNAPAQLQPLAVGEKVQTIMPGASKTIFLRYKVKQDRIDTVMTVGFQACALGDEITTKIRIRPRGFPVTTSFSGQQVDKEFVFETKHLVQNSLRLSFSAYPDVISDLMKGVEGILQEPYGCFEQTSCTAYPNAMVLHYMKSSGSTDSRALARANDLLDRGYKRLTSFETPSKGYEWFGAAPAHEGLTAYGIMEFVDMQRAGQQIDEKMLDRTARWLLMHRDGRGGFAREKRALHDFGRISDEVMNGYIVYALADAGYKEIGKEYESSLQIAMKSGDTYLLALSANAALKMGKTKDAAEAMSRLLKLQKDDGSFNGASHSITYSQGRSLSIETTGLAILAILGTESPDVKALDRAVKYLLTMRDGSGAFSSTQATVLALKALTGYAIFNKRTKEGGQVLVFIDGKRVAEHSYKAGERTEILLQGLEKYVSGEGKHTVRVKYIGVDNALPYSLSANWSTTLPLSNAECALDIRTKLEKTELFVGETARLTVTVKNRQQHDLPSAMVVIGIPAGLSVQPWQLKELQEKHAFDYYEIIGDRLAIYYRGLAPADVKEINLDLKAELPGAFNCPASSAYLYYTNELKSWASAGTITVKKNEK